MENLFTFIQTNDLVQKIITSVIGLVIIVFLVRLARKLINNYIDDNHSRLVLRKVANAIGAILSVFFIIGVMNAHLAEFTVAVGVIGAGVAFALQEVLTSIAGWIALSLQNFYHIGDRVQLGEIKGDVIEISILRTTLMELGEWVNGDLYSGRIVRISNSIVFKQPVYNYSADFPFLWDEIVIPVKYGSDYLKAREIIEQSLYEVTGDYIPQATKTWDVVLHKYLIEKATIEPMITLTANDNWMEYTGRYVVDYKKRRSTKNDIYSQIIQKIEQSDGKVELASATFSLVEAPQLSIQLNKDVK